MSNIVQINKNETPNDLMTFKEFAEKYGLCTSYQTFLCRKNKTPQTGLLENFRKRNFKSNVGLIKWQE